jgi:hypothetical protein
MAVHAMMGAKERPMQARIAATLAGIVLVLATKVAG